MDSLWYASFEVLFIILEITNSSMVKLGAMRGTKVKSSQTEAEEIAELERGIHTLNQDVGPSDQQAGAQLTLNAI